jgi:ABC-type transporter Mla subunit MlaD
VTAKPFKFRYVNRIAGAFLFLAGSVLAVLLLLVAKSQHWFERETQYRVEMPVGFREDDNPGGTLGIRAGSEVRVIGNQVGHVDRVELCAGEELLPIDSFESVDPNDIRIVAVLAVKGGFSHFIGPDSVAVLKFDLGGLGSAYFDISRGTKRFDPALDEPGVPRRLAFGRERDAKEEVFEIVTRLEAEVIPAVRRIEETATAAKDFFEKLNDENESLYRSLALLEKGIADMNRVMAQAASGEGALGDMIQSDTRMRREFNEFATTLNSGTKSLESAVNNLGAGIEELRAGGITSFNEAAKAFPGTIDNTNAAINQIEEGARQFQETVREFEVLVEGLQKHWLVRKNIEDPLEDPPENLKPRTSPSRPEANKAGEKAAGEGQRDGLLKKLFKKEN